MIACLCPNCGKKLTFDDDQRGTQVSCAGCGRAMLLPAIQQSRGKRKPTRKEFEFDREDGEPAEAEPEEALPHSPPWRAASEP